MVELNSSVKSRDVQSGPGMATICSSDDGSGVGSVKPVDTMRRRKRCYSLINGQQLYCYCLLCARI